MIKDKHSNYTVNDFLTDQSFLNALKHKRQADIDYWKAWLDAKPGNIGTYKAAELQLKIFLSPERITAKGEFFEDLWTDIEHTIQKDKEQRAKVVRFRILTSAAAVILMCIAATVWFFNSTITLQTTYGQTREVRLPDGTQVVLNANSELKYPRAYTLNPMRETYLKGEGYFKVTKGNRFVVYTKNINVQVLGTEFNVKERRGITKVALVRGSIEVNQNNPAVHQTMIMRPSELYTYKEKTSEAVKKAVSPESSIAWIDKKAIAENTRIGDVIADYEDTYGQKIILEDQALYERVIDGVIPMGNKESTLFVIANILNLRAEKKGDTILLKSYK